MLFKKLNKKNIAIVLLIALIICLSACHKADTNKSDRNLTVDGQEWSEESTADTNENIEDETKTNEGGLLGLITSFSPREWRVNKMASEESELIKEKSEEIVRCLTEEDKEAFRLLFCDEVRQSETFDQEVDAVFDYFSCSAYINSYIVDHAGGSSSIEFGRRTQWSVSPKIKYIEVMPKNYTDGNDLSDLYYGVSYGWHIKDKEHPEREGLYHFEIKLLNTEGSVEVGGSKS